MTLTHLEIYHLLGYGAKSKSTQPKSLREQTYIGGLKNKISLDGTPVNENTLRLQRYLMAIQQTLPQS